MKIVCLADTHNLLNEIEIPDADVLVIAGDLTMSGSIKEIAAFDKGLGRLSHKHKLICAGNHDFLFERQFALAKSLITNGIYLQDEEITIDGIKFYLSPWQPEFNNWAFNLRRGIPLEKKWAKIPDDTNILVTHGPPHRILDEVYRDQGIHWEPDGEGERKDFGYSIEHVGCRELLKRIKHLPKLRYHIFGHIHKNYGMTTQAEICFVNASNVNEKYQPVNNPIVIEI